MRFLMREHCKDDVICKTERKCITTYYLYYLLVLNSSYKYLYPVQLSSLVKKQKNSYFMLE